MYSSTILAYRARYFKPFQDTDWIEVRPITLLFGHNSSGKSALLSLLPMLRQTVEDPNSETPFVFSSDAGVDLGTYEEIAHGREISLSNPVWFGIKAHLRNSRRFFIRQGTLTAMGVKEFVAVEIAVSYNKKRRRIAITDFQIFSDQHPNTPLFRVYRKTTAANQKWHIESTFPVKDRESRLLWRHFFPFLRSRLLIDDDSRPLWDLLRGLQYAVTDSLQKVVHLGPSRAFPRRAYRITGESPNDVGILGDNWLNIFVRARERERLAEEINQWLARLGYELSIEWGRQGYVHPMLTDTTTGLKVSLKDVGFGISQVLPVLVQGFVSEPGTILILEQPEIHLHPKAQAELGDMLIAIARRGVRVLVETHSEHLLLRIQRRMAEAMVYSRKDALSSNDIVVYYIEKVKGVSNTHRIQMDDFGNFLNLPGKFGEFFSDDYNEAIARAKLHADALRRG